MLTNPTSNRPGLLATVLVLLVIFAGCGRPGGVEKSAGKVADGTHDPNPEQNHASVLEGHVIEVAEAMPPKGPSALALVASAKPAQDWSVKLGEIKPPEKLGSAWHAPFEAPREEFWIPSLLTTGG